MRLQKPIDDIERRGIALAAEYMPKRVRATTIGLMFVGYNIGAAIGGFVASWTIEDFGWSYVFYIGGLGAVPMFLGLAYALPESGALFSGDHVMGWATSVVSPPDGDMGDYMASLDKLMGRDDRVYYPGHGEAVDNPQRLVRGMLGHRKQREGQILRPLREAPMAIPAMTARMYVGLDPRLLGAAQRSVLAHLYDLRHRALVEEEGDTWRIRA